MRLKVYGRRQEPEKEGLQEEEMCSAQETLYWGLETCDKEGAWD